MEILGFEEMEKGVLRWVTCSATSVSGEHDCSDSGLNLDWGTGSRAFIRRGSIKSLYCLHYSG